MKLATRINTERTIIAIDDAGVHVRKTLCVIHRHEIGEIHYHSRPVRSIKSARLRNQISNLFNEKPKKDRCPHDWILGVSAGCAVKVCAYKGCANKKVFRPGTRRWVNYE